MRPKDIFLFLPGNRGAIERISGSWWSLLIGAILVHTRYNIQEDDALLIKNMPQLRQIIEDQADATEHKRLIEIINDLHSEQNSPPQKDGSAPGR